MCRQGKGAAYVSPVAIAACCSIHACANVLVSRSKDNCSYLQPEQIMAQKQEARLMKLSNEMQSIIMDMCTKESVKGKSHKNKKQRRVVRGAL